MSDERQPDPPIEEPPTEEQPPPVQEPPPITAAPHPTAAIVDAWFQSHINGSILGRSTESWNHLQTKIPVLKAMLAKL